MNRKIFPILVFAALLGCSSSAQNEGEGKQATKPTAPVVTDERKDLLLSWFADGGPQVASTVAEVPEGSRKSVRVQDPAVPPEKRDAHYIFLADLTRKDRSGSYPVRAELRAEYEAKRHKAKPVAILPPPAGADQDLSVIPKGAAQAGAPVVMYATKHCPVCVKARRWLLEQRIPYVEKDIERDAAAAQDLARKGKAQGLPTSGVPIFEIRGRLVPGFEPSAILKLLGVIPNTQTSI